jgi:lysophospholipid acyltransferase (LPLAT)-like uncharacterized protein
MSRPPTTAFEKTSRSPTFLHRLAGWIGSLYLRLVGATSYIEKRDDPDYRACVRGPEALIYALWHNTQAFLAYAHRGEHASVMVSQSKDGEYIAQIMKRLGLHAVRGSTSRGGGSALREMIRRVQEGGRVGFTPDGPKGPLETVHGGVVEAARATGRPIVPTSIASRRKLVFKKSWDQFFVPLPFSHIVVAHGKPLLIAKDMLLEDAKTLIREELNRVRDQALQALGEAPSYRSMLVHNLLAPARGLAAANAGFWTRRPPKL